MVVQALDGILTYFGMLLWGPSIEANPLISAAVAYAGPGTGLAAAKLTAMGLGILLHLRCVHHMVALLTMFYLLVAILPWTIVLIIQ
jgi:hypothetical protein